MKKKKREQPDEWLIINIQAGIGFALATIALLMLLYLFK